MSASPSTNDIALDPAAVPTDEDPAAVPADDFSSPTAHQTSTPSVRFADDGSPKRRRVHGPSSPADDPYIVQLSSCATHSPQASTLPRSIGANARTQSLSSSPSPLPSPSACVVKAPPSEPTPVANLPKAPPVVSLDDIPVDKRLIIETSAKEVFGYTPRDTTKLRPSTISHTPTTHTSSSSDAQPMGNI